jgi:hypothetical protein
VKPLMSFVAVVGLAIALSACSPGSNPLSLNYTPQSKEDLLSSSGFKTLPLKTPAQIASFKSLPPHRLTQTVFKGRSVWIYPDRNVCGCLYIGTQTAYDAFIKKGRQQIIDTIANKAYDNNDPDPYNPTATMANLDWGDAWDTADAYGMYLN